MLNKLLWELQVADKKIDLVSAITTILIPFCQFSFSTRIIPYLKMLKGVWFISCEEINFVLRGLR